MRYVLLAATALLLSAASCEPESGPGFSAEVCLQLDHHGVAPATATVYAVSAAGFPGFGGDLAERFPLDERMRPNGRVCFGGLGVGPYWFAAEGWDDAIADSVRGTKFVEVTTRADFYEARLEVSEQH